MRFYNIMVVKDKKGRKRYILFTIEDIERKDLIKAIKDDYLKLRLIFYNRRYGIVRCKHTDKDRAIDFLTNLVIKNHKIKTLKTSGTIKKLKNYVKSISLSEPKPCYCFFPAYCTFFIAYSLWNWYS